MEPDTEREKHADLAADAVYAMWRDVFMKQTESALIFSRIVTGETGRLPDDGEVRGFLHGLVRGKLVEPPAPPKPWWRTMLDRISR